MIAKFLPYLRAHRWQVAWALAQVFLVAGVELLKPWPLQIVIDYVLGGNTPPASGPIGGGPLGALLSLPAGVLLLFACIAIVIIHFAAGGLTLWHNYTTIRLGQSMVAFAELLRRGGSLPTIIASNSPRNTPKRPGSRSPRETADVADIQQAMLLNCRRRCLVAAGIHQSGAGGVAVLPVQLQYP